MYTKLYANVSPPSPFLYHRFLPRVDLFISLCILKYDILQKPREIASWIRTYFHCITPRKIVNINLQCEACLTTRGFGTFDIFLVLLFLLIKRFSYFFIKSFIIPIARNNDAHLSIDPLIISCLKLKIIKKNCIMYVNRNTVFDETSMKRIGNIFDTETWIPKFQISLWIFPII